MINKIAMNKMKTRPTGESAVRNKTAFRQDRRLRSIERGCCFAWNENILPISANNRSDAA